VVSAPIIIGSKNTDGFMHEFAGKNNDIRGSIK
jgi:hypothetical protein